MNNARLSCNRIYATGLALLFLVLVLVAPSPAPIVAQESAQPSKKQLIETLTKVVQQLESKQYAETEKYFYLPKDFEHKKFEKLLKRNVISKRGIEAIDIGGEYGNAIGILRKSKVEEAANEYSVAADQLSLIHI